SPTRTRRSPPISRARPRGTAPPWSLPRPPPWFAPLPPSLPCSLHAGPGERRRAGARASLRQPLHHGAHEAPEPVVVLLHHLGHRRLGHGLHPRVPLDADIVVRDQGDIHIAQLHLPREDALRVVGHVDDLPSLRPKPPALGPGAEPGPLDDHHGPPLVHGDPEPPR